MMTSYIDEYVDFLYIMINLDYVDYEIKIGVLHSIMKAGTDPYSTIQLPKEALINAIEKKRRLAIEVLNIAKTTQSMEYLEAALGVLQFMSQCCRKISAYLINQGGIAKIIKGILNKNMKYAGIKESCILLIRSLLAAEENTREVTEHLFEEIISIIREVVTNHQNSKNIGLFRLILQLSRVLVKDDQFFDHIRSEGIFS